MVKKRWEVLKGLIIHVRMITFVKVRVWIDEVVDLMVASHF